MNRDLQGIFDALLEGVVILDDRGRIELANGEAARLFGASKDLSPGRELAAVVGADHPVLKIVDRVRASGRASIHDEVEFPRRTSADVPVDVAVSILTEDSLDDADFGVDADASERSGDRAESGSDPRTQPGIAIALRDRSTTRTLREEVVERERQESYGLIAAGIAHEVKNPLGGIRGAAELIGMNAENDRSRKTSALIVKEVDRISDLVDELMVFARGDQLRIESVNVHRPLDALLDLLQFERGYERIEIKRFFDPSLPEIPADADRLQQAFLNLARNAMQAMEDEGGILELSTRMSLDHRLVGPDGRQQPTVEICFADTGPGIPNEILDRMSTPFFTTKKKGTGLGLSVARHWIRRHGGRLRIDSVAGEGTRIHVHLPLRAHMADASEPASVTP